jgi:hypothetical protein
VTPTRKKLVEEIKRLIKSHNHSSMDLFLKLHDMEKSAQGKALGTNKAAPWADSQTPTFESFLKRHVPHFETDRYVKFKAALGHWGEAFLRKVGAEAISILMKKPIIKADTRKAEFNRLVSEDIKRNGVAPGLERLNQHARKVAPELDHTGRSKPAVDRDARIRELEAELAKAQEALSKAKERVSELEAENAILKKASRKAKRTGGSISALA